MTCAEEGPQQVRKGRMRDFIVPTFDRKVWRLLNPVRRRYNRECIYELSGNRDCLRADGFVCRKGYRYHTASCKVRRWLVDL